MAGSVRLQAHPLRSLPLKRKPFSAHARKYEIFQIFSDQPGRSRDWGNPYIPVYLYFQHRDALVYQSAVRILARRGDDGESVVERALLCCAMPLG